MMNALAPTKVGFFAEKIKEIANELNFSNGYGFLVETGDYLENKSTSYGVHADLYFSQGSVSAFGAAISELYEIKGLNILELTDAKLKGQKMLRPNASLFICCLDNLFVTDKALLDYYKSQQDNYALGIFIYSGITEAQAKQMAQSVIRYSKARFVEFNPLSSGKLGGNEILTAEELSALENVGLVNQIKPVIQVLNQTIVSEHKLLRTRKILGGQQQIITRKDEQGMNTMELQGMLRNILGKSSTDLEKSLRTKYDELNKPATGEHAKFLHKMSGKLTDFVRIKIAEKDEREEIRLPQDYEKSFLQDVRGSLQKEMQADKEQLETISRELVVEVNHLLRNKGISAIDAIAFPSLPEPDKSLNSYCLWGRTFKSELIKKGIMEYFVALRDYTGVIMVATGLLGPFTIIASISDNSVLKAMSNVVKFSMAAIALFLIVYGIHDLRSRIPKKRKEEFDKELEKAREFVINEGKKMFTETSRDWTSVSITWLKEFCALVTGAYEKKLKEEQAKKVDQITQDKTQQQKRQMNLEMQMKNIASAEKIRDSIITRCREMVSESEKQIKFA